MAVCTFDGNSDMYGIGIRIGFYIQWYNAILASWLAPSEVLGVRLTITIFIFATFVALVIQVAQDVSNLEVVEVYIILLLTFGYYLFLVPLYIWRLLTACNHAFDPTRYPRVPTGAVYSVLSFLLLVAVASFQLWFWFARVPSLDRRSCQEYGFFFAKIRINQKAFVTVNVVFYLMLLISCLVILLISLGKMAGSIEEKESPELPIQNIEGLQKLNTFFNVAVASTVVAATELTVRWNHIEGVNSILSAGQTIPLLIGIGGLIRIFYVYFVKPADDQMRPNYGPRPVEEMPAIIIPPRPPGPRPIDRIPMARIPVPIDRLPRLRDPNPPPQRPPQRPP